MAQLPTKEQLEQLCHHKGHEALVWYAWRNALRYLSSLGSLGPNSLYEFWEKDTFQQVYSVCRVSLVLAQWSELSGSINYPHTATDNNAGSDHATDLDTDLTAYAYAAAYAANYSADYADSTDITDAASVVAYADSYSYYYVDYACADYELLQKTDIIDESFWLSQPLWLSKWTGVAIDEPEWFEQNCQQLSQSLSDIGLGFLADDLKDLWSGNELKPHIKNYLNEYSEVELNDGETLRRLILGEEEADKIHAVRVLLLGPGGAGKSSLADRLQGNPIEAVKRMTVGVDYLQHQPLNLQSTFPSYGLDQQPLDLFLWDFGGQTIFHGLHRAFLHENCVYVLVVDSRHEQAPDEWLQQIQHLAGSQVKVLLVTNQYEECKTPQNQARLLREFPGLLSSESFFYFSCLDCVNNTEADFKRFVAQLAQNSLDSQKMVLKETLDVQKALQACYQSSNDIFLEMDDLEEVVEATTGKNNIAEEVADKLQQLGFLVKVDHRETSYCLKPEWAIDHAYELLYSEVLRTSNGVLAYKSFKQCFKEKTKNQHIAHLIDFLQERSLCHQLNSSEYFFPDSAKANEPKQASDVINNGDGLVLRFDLPYLPLGFHARLVYRLFAVNGEVGIQSPDDIWRQGFILRKGSSQGVVQYLLRKSTIEMTLLGSLKDYSELLNVFLLNLKTAVASNNSIQAAQIHPSVVLNQQTFYVHSSESLIKVLGQIENYNELINKVTEMASKINVNVGDGSQVAIDAQNVTQKYQSDNQTLEINTDQREKISEVIAELLKDVSEFPADQLSAVAQVNAALGNETPESRNLLGRVWTGLCEVTDFTNNAMGVGQFVVEHQAKIAAAITAAAAVV